MKRNGTLFFLTFFFVLALVVIFKTVKESRSDSNNIRIASDDASDRVFTGLISDFQISHPNVKIEIVHLPFSDLENKIDSNFTDGVIPDIVYVYSSTIADLCSHHLLTSLDDVVKADPSFPLDDFYPSLIGNFSMDGHLFAVPRGVNPVCFLYYNKDAFRTAKLDFPNESWNWNNFLIAAKKLTKHQKLNGIDQIQQYGFTDDWAMVEPWIYSSGGNWVDNPEKPTQWTFNRPEFIHGIKFRADLLYKYHVMFSRDGVMSAPEAQNVDLFLSGSAAMFLSYNGRQFLEENKNFDWSVTLIPKGPTGKRGFAMEGYGFGITNACKNKKAAWALVSYLTGADAEKRWALSGKYQPALRSVADSPAFFGGQERFDKKILLTAVSAGIFPPKLPGWNALQRNKIEPAFEKVWVGKTTPEQAVSQLYDQLKNVSFH